MPSEGRLDGGRPDILYVSDKDPDYVYRWVNTKDMLFMSAQLDGYAVVEGDDPGFKISPMPLTLQTTDKPAGGAARTRGDVVLMRISREAYEKGPGQRERLARERQQTTIDTLVMEADENAKRRLREMGQPTDARPMVFREDTPGIGPG